MNNSSELTANDFETLESGTAERLRSEDDSRSLINVLSRFDADSVAKAMDTMIVEGALSPPGVVLVPAGSKRPPLPLGGTFIPLVTGRDDRRAADDGEIGGGSTERVFGIDDGNGIEGATSITETCGTKDAVDYKYKKPVSVKKIVVRNTEKPSRGCDQILRTYAKDKDGDLIPTKTIIKPGKTGEVEDVKNVERITISCSGNGGSRCTFIHQITIL